MKSVLFKITCSTEASTQMLSYEVDSLLVLPMLITICFLCSLILLPMIAVDLFYLAKFILHSLQMPM